MYSIRSHPLRGLRSKLAPDVRLLIVTHDESSLLSRLLRAKWPAFCVRHPENFNPKSMRALLAVAGFEGLVQLKMVNYFPVSFLVKRALWTFALRVARTPSFQGSNPGLGLGNMFTVTTPAWGE
jgi:hypothetical protein